MVSAASEAVAIALIMWPHTAPIAHWFRPVLTGVAPSALRHMSLRSLNFQLPIPRHCVALACLTFASAAFAQKAPTAGEQLLQIPAAPNVTAPSPNMRVESSEAGSTESADTRKILVTALRLNGVTAIPEEELVQASGFAPGAWYSLDELRALATKMTASYRKAGYVLARIFLPAQDVTDGTVTMEVAEGRIGRIELRNQSGVSDQVVHTLLGGLEAAYAVNMPALERSLLLLTDIPGVKTKSVLRPGTLAGSTDLMVDLTPGQKIVGNLEADNHGNSYTGTYRIGANLTFNALTGNADAASVRLLTSGTGMQYGRVGYQRLLGPLNAGVAYTAMAYTLGGEFANSKAHGTANIGSGYLSYPLLRSRDRDMAIQLAVENKDFADRIATGSPANNADKNVLNGTLSWKGNYQAAGGDSLGNYIVSVTHGVLNLQNAEAIQVDTSSAKTRGDFEKLTYALAHQHALTKAMGLSVSASGQWASKNLDASEKFSLGGANGIRAYPAGEAAGDEGVLLSVELRTALPLVSESWGGPAQLVGFWDAGSIAVNRVPWETTATANRRSLQGAGFGLNFLHSSRLMLKAYYAFPLGGEKAATSANGAGRFWVQMNKVF
jgi:hemolysin activation/secretion protein